MWLSIEYECHYDDDFIGDGNGPDDMVNTRSQAPSRQRRLIWEDNIHKLYKNRNKHSYRRLQSSSSSSSYGDHYVHNDELYISRTLSGFICSLLGTMGMLLGLYIGSQWKNAPVFAIAHTNNDDNKNKRWNDGLVVMSDKLRYYVTGHSTDVINDDERIPIIATAVDNDNTKKWYN